MGRADRHDAVWRTEHHLFDDGYLSQPLTLASGDPRRELETPADRHRDRAGTPLRPAIASAEQGVVGRQSSVAAGSSVDSGPATDPRVEAFAPMAAPL